jgi:hypothetical protein
MNVQSTKAPSSRKPASPQKSFTRLVTATAVTILLLFVGWLGWHDVGPGSAPANGALQGLDPRWMVDKAMESKGDIDKLSPEDRKQLTSRWGEATARAMWESEYDRAQHHDGLAQQPPPADN